MRRIIITIGACLALVLGLQTYAQASITKNKCLTLYADDHTTDEACMVVKYHAMSGAPGISVDRLTISYDGADMQSVDCYSIRLRNANGVTTWVKQGGECDIPSYPSYRTFVPIQDMPQSAYADLIWSANGNVAGATDKDFTLTIRCDQ